jgi:molybdopterin-guanine dinucleotide biosynthesis protein A
MLGAVLIGGQSRRFGRDKVLADFMGRPLIEHVLEIMSSIFDEVILVGHLREGLTQYRVVEDLRPGCGPLGGIYTALATTGAEHCFVCAADMPNLNIEFISYMITLKNDHDIVMPLWSKGREPLHAIYRKTIMPLAKSLLEQHSYRIFSLIQAVDTLFIPEENIRMYGDPVSLFSNLNTVHDMARMES